VSTTTFWFFLVNNDEDVKEIVRPATPINISKKDVQFTPSEEVWQPDNTPKAKRRLHFDKLADEETFKTTLAGAIAKLLVITHIIINCILAKLILFFFYFRNIRKNLTGLTIVNTRKSS
jgi:hypothetical protein